MSAFGGKADMVVCGCPLSRSLLGVKRTSPFALHMSASDPKRTLLSPLLVCWFRAVRCLGLGASARRRLDEKPSAYCGRAQSGRRHVEIEIMCSRDRGDGRALQPAW